MFYSKNFFLHFELGQLMFTVLFIARSYFPETPEIRINISPALLVSDSKVISSQSETFSLDVPPIISVPALVWYIITV